MSLESLITFFKPYHAVLLAVFAVALGSGWSMLPGESERIAMLERDGHAREALGILESAYEGGDRRTRTLRQMLTLYEDQGNVAKAREILETLVTERPRDASLRDRLAKFYRGTGERSPRIAALRAQIGVRYAEAACRELIAAERLAGDPVAEAEAIQECRQRNYRRADDLSRLAMLAAASSDPVLASQIMRSIDDVRRLKEPSERYLFLSLLLDQGQPREASRRAVRWIRSAKDQTLAVGLIDVLAKSKYPEAAMEVAKDAGSVGDRISLTVAERMLEQAQPHVAQLYLRGWLENAQFESEEVVSRFVEAALLAQDHATALEGARKYGFSRLPPATSRDLVRALRAAGASKEADELSAAGPVAEEFGPPNPFPQDAGLGKIGVSVESQTRLAASGPEQVDPLTGWRRFLAEQMSDDAVHRSAALGRPVPKHYGAWHGEARAHTRVLSKTAKVLQRNKKIRSLRLKQKLVRENARSRSR